MDARIGRAEDLSAMGCAVRLVVAQHAAPLQEKRNPRWHYASWRYLAAREAVAGGILERAHAFRSAVAAPSTDFAFSISETIAEPTTAASARAAKNGNVAGHEMPKQRQWGAA